MRYSIRRSNERTGERESAPVRARTLLRGVSYGNKGNPAEHAKGTRTTSTAARRRRGKVKTRDKYKGVELRAKERERGLEAGKEKEGARK